VGRAEGRLQVGLAESIRASGLRFAVTGATGWLGRAAAEVLARALAPTGEMDRLLLFASRERDIKLDAGPVMRVHPLRDLSEHPVDVLLHYAYVTREHADERGVPDYVLANLTITAEVLTAITAHSLAFVAYASSGAASLAASRPLDVRSDPYGAMKVMDELVMRRAAANAGARSLVVRVYNVAGPWMRKSRAFALGDLLHQAAAGEQLTIRASRPVVRSFVDVQDIASVAIATALDSETGSDIVVETAGDEVIEVGDLAERILAVLGRPRQDIVRAWDPTALPDSYLGDGRAFHALAARAGVVLRPLDEQIARTARGLGMTVDLGETHLPDRP